MRKNPFDVLIDVVLCSDCPVGQGINSVIILLLLMGIGLVLWQFKRIISEKKALNIAKRNREIINKEHITDLKICMDRLLKDVDKKSIIFRRIHELIKIRYSDKIDHETLRDILVNKEGLKTGFVRYISNILILLGLAGTVWGLSIAVTEMQPLVTQIKEYTDLPNILKAMFNILSGMKTAFSTTIAGIFSTVILTCVHFLYTRVANSFLVQIEEFSTVELVPCLLIPEEKDASLIRFIDAFSQSTTLLEGNKSVLNTFAENLVGVISKAEESIKNHSNLVERLDRNIEAMERSNQSISETHKKTNELLLEQKNIQVRNVEIMENMADSAGKQTNTYNEFNHVFQNIESKLQGSFDILKQGIEKIHAENKQEVQKAFEQAIKNQQGLISDIFKDRKDIESIFIEIIELYKAHIISEREVLSNNMSQIVERLMKSQGDDFASKSTVNKKNNSFNIQ